MKGEEMNLVDEITREIGEELSYKVEQYVRLKTKPKPKWMPYFLWKWLLGKLIVLETTPITFKENQNE